VIHTAAITRGWGAKGGGEDKISIMIVVRGWSPAYYSRGKIETRYAVRNDDTS
jgi:hypothetical protein